MVGLQAFSLSAADERAARLLPDIALHLPNETTEDADLQAVSKNGSGGTRTRDLRRDRPVLVSRDLIDPLCVREVLRLIQQGADFAGELSGRSVRHSCASRTEKDTRAQ
jgi:hypothetical protein